MLTARVLDALPCMDLHSQLRMLPGLWQLLRCLDSPRVL